MESSQRRAAAETHSAIYILRTSSTHGQKKTTTTTSLNSPQFTFMDVDYLSNVYFERGKRQPHTTTTTKKKIEIFFWLKSCL
jgi:hypothetical protein